MAKKLIVGLGNPGDKYKGTRHNIGFEIVEALAAAYGVSIKKTAAKSRIGIGNVLGKQVVFCLPQTYMNLSGEGVAGIIKHFDIDAEDVLIVCDDINLGRGVIRLRARGGDGGHKGLRSIIEILGSEDFSRLRFGVDKPDGMQPVEDYVLRKFSKDEAAVIAKFVKQSLEACLVWVESGIDEAMNRFNGID